MTIREATESDIPEIMAIFESARKYMRETGNATQWLNNYPFEEVIRDDIRDRCSFVGTDEQGKIHMTFAFPVGEDSTYQVIERGAWLSDKPYGAIHRLASDRQVKGAFAECLAFCRTIHKEIRADTHENNLTMQHLLEKHGFKRCGIIFVEDGTERVAYQLCDNSDG